MGCSKRVALLFVCRQPFVAPMLIREREEPNAGTVATHYWRFLLAYPVLWISREEHLTPS